MAILTDRTMSVTLLAKPSPLVTFDLDYPSSVSTSFENYRNQVFGKNKSRAGKKIFIQLKTLTHVPQIPNKDFQCL